MANLVGGAGHSKGIRVLAKATSGFGWRFAFFGSRFA